MTVDVPAGLEAITPEWMSGALQDSFPGVKVSRVDVVPINLGVAMTVRIKLEYASRPTGAPDSVCMKCSFGRPHSEIMREGGLYSKESHMYAVELPRLRLNTPQSFAAGVDESTGSAFVMLEDLSLRGARFCSADQSESPETMAELLKQFARLHAATWGAPWLTEKRWLHHGIPLGEPDPVYDLYMDRVPELLQLPRGGAVPAKLRSVETLRRALYQVLEIDGKLTPCLIHGDAHIGNQFVDREGHPGIVDWQCARAGHWSHDISKTMMSGLDVEDRRRHEVSLLEGYLDELRRHGVEAPAFESAWVAYRRHAMFGFWIWLVTPPEMQTELRVVSNVYKFGQAALDLDALGALDEAL